MCYLLKKQWLTRYFCKPISHKVFDPLLPLHNTHPHNFTVYSSQTYSRLNSDPQQLRPYLTSCSLMCSSPLLNLLLFYGWIISLSGWNLLYAGLLCTSDRVAGRKSSRTARSPSTRGREPVELTRDNINTGGWWQRYS